MMYRAGPSDALLLPGFTASPAFLRSKRTHPPRGGVSSASAGDSKLPRFEHDIGRPIIDFSPRLQRR